MDVTSDPRVDDALARLARLDERPLTEHVAVFEEVHRLLQAALREPDVGASAGG